MNYFKSIANIAREVGILCRHISTKSIVLITAANSGTEDT